jgi:N-acetyltransferase
MPVAFRKPAEIDGIVRAFEDCTMPRDQWKHHTHLAVGMWYARHYPEVEALARVRNGIQRYNAAHGIQITPTGGYHETITQFWYRVVRAFLVEAGPNPDIVELTNALIEKRCNRNLPFEFYSHERMWSPEARAGWVWPDLKPLDHTLAPLVVEPVTLEGQYVRLEPLGLRHLPLLTDVGIDDELWHWTTQRVQTAGDMRHYIESALHQQAKGEALPFATFEKVTGMAVGCTRFASIERHHRRMEIGWTWVARAWQRSPMNTEAKYVMFKHAFETLGCLRVELKTDVLNQQSRAAIERIGAKQEGVLRSHMVVAGGRVRDTVYYSVVAAEWPEVKKYLEGRIAEKAKAAAGAQG